MKEDDDDDDKPTEKEMARYRENLARHQAIAQTMIGRRIDSAIMLENGTLMMSSQGALDDGQMTSANWDILPCDPDYAKTCKCFGLEKPGDSNAKGYRWIDGNWVDDTEVEQ